MLPLSVIHELRNVHTLKIKEKISNDKSKKENLYAMNQDSPFNNTDCVGINIPLLNTSTQSNIEEHTTEFYSNNVTNSMAPTQSSKIEGSSPFMFPVLICLILSLLFLLSTIPAVMKRRLARQKRKQSVMHGNRYHEISLDYLQAKSVDETPSKSMTYSTISGLKETAPVNTTNVYSVFSVQSSVYNKLKRSRKRSRKNYNNDNSIYNPLNVNQGADQNATADGVNNGITSLENRIDISCNESSSTQNGEYSHAKVISMESEDSKIVLMDTVRRNTMRRNTMRKSSSLPSAIVTSAEDYELTRCVSVHCNLRSQSCEILDHEMTGFAKINDSRSKSSEKYFTENVDNITRKPHNNRQSSEAKVTENTNNEIMRKTSVCNKVTPACDVQNTEN